MIAKYYGKTLTAQQLRIRVVAQQGTSLTALSEGAERIGFKTIMAEMSFSNLESDALLPAIIHQNDNHFVVLYEFASDGIIVGDPLRGLKKYRADDLVAFWAIKKQSKDICTLLLLEPTPGFRADEGVKPSGIRRAVQYLVPYKRLLLQLLLGMCAASCLQLLLPIVTQSIVDKGIAVNNLGFVQLMIIGQVVILLGRLILEIIRSQILLYIGSRLGVSVLSDFLAKLMRLPLDFFFKKSKGELLQRMSDNTKVQNFLTGTALNVILSSFNLVLFGLILAVYDARLLFVFLTGSALHFGWTVLFLSKWKELNIKTFAKVSYASNLSWELLSGIIDLKLFNAQRFKRWEWEREQIRIYKLQTSSLRYQQIQQVGSFFLTESRNILITYLTVTSVMEGSMSLGMMLSVQYIIGQLNGPISSFIGLGPVLQDVKISSNRLSEIQNEADEDHGLTYRALPSEITEAAISIQNVSFRYTPDGPFVLNEVNVNIMPGAMVAIVGASGSGKSTLLKLLLKLHNPTQGRIVIGETDLTKLSSDSWRDHCSTVLQEGFIFSTTFIQNVAMEEFPASVDRVYDACRIANIHEFIESLPSDYNSIIGTSGVGLSQGQKQRLLIARAIYRDPSFLLLDEATNSLDAINEKQIMANLQKYCRRKTVIVVAHRLSTVVNAHKILVMDGGRIVEMGNHEELLALGGVYRNLINSQRESSLTTLQ